MFCKINYKVTQPFHIVNNKIKNQKPYNLYHDLYINVTTEFEDQFGINSGIILPKKVFFGLKL